MLDIRTFGPQGGNVLYKALSHPLVVDRMRALERDLSGTRLVIYDPDNFLPTVVGLYPGLKPDYVVTHNTEHVGCDDGFGRKKHALIDLPSVEADSVLALSFEQAKMDTRLGDLLCGRSLHTLEKMRLPETFLPYRRPYLDKLNFATNFAFFRDDDNFATRLVTANYWSHYGACCLRYWFRLYDQKGGVLAEWTQCVDEENAGVLVDSTEIRQRFHLPSFTGQIFIHVIGAKGHDVVKYALDTFGKGDNPSLSVTHDANAWPSMRFATLPAPEHDEALRVWIQNSHGTAIPQGAITFNPMGQEDHRAVPQKVGPYETVAVDIGALFPESAWPTQFEMRAGQHVVRPRYEIVQHGRTRIAHLNVERADIAPDPAIRHMDPSLGRGIILPFPVLDPQQFETYVQPNPMSEKVLSLPVRIDMFNEQGEAVGSYFLGNLPRQHRTAVALHELMSCPGHADLVYDFRDGGDADGWLHSLIRYRDRQSEHAAETSFGGHIFNTLMTWRSEPQSYSGPPPGLTTRLFLKLGQVFAGEVLKSFCCLIYPHSAEGGKPSSTLLHLYARNGTEISQKTITIQPSGSFMVRPHQLFSAEDMQKAGEGGYVLIRDLTCRLFGYHGLENGSGGFSLDHMFGF